MAEGFIKNTVVGGVNTFSYIYNYTDHLGNVRVSYEKDAATGLAKIVDEKNYYPFGLAHVGYNSIVSTKKSPYQFNCKQTLGFGYENMIDFGARNYMADIGRWGCVDPLAENGHTWSPYNYALNNPVYFIDPDGKWITVYDWDSGTSYRYNDGQYYTQDDKTKKWDVEASVASNSYLGKLMAAFNSITGGDKNSFGSKFLALFANDKINIRILENPQIKENSTKPDGSAIFTSFTQNVSLDTSAGVKSSDFYVTLFHELAHGYSDQVYNKELLDATWIEKDDDLGIRKPITKSEIYASDIENRLRQEKGLPLRVNYVKGLESSRLLQSTNVGYQKTPSTMEVLTKILTTKR
jgi:RHS repeat-associated protein